MPFGRTTGEGPFCKTTTVTRISHSFSSCSLTSVNAAYCTRDSYDVHDIYGLPAAESSVRKCRTASSRIATCDHHLLLLRCCDDQPSASLTVATETYYCEKYLVAFSSALCMQPRTHRQFRHPDPFPVGLWTQGRMPASARGQLMDNFRSACRDELSRTRLTGYAHQIAKFTTEAVYVQERPGRCW